MPHSPERPSLQPLSTLQGLGLSNEATLNVATKLAQAQNAGASENMQNTNSVISAKPDQQSQQSKQSRAIGTPKQEQSTVLCRI